MTQGHPEKTDDLPDFDPRELRDKIEEIESGNYMLPIPGIPAELAEKAAEMRARAPERLKELKAQEEEWDRFEANATPEQRKRFQQQLDAWDAEKQDEDRVDKLVELAHDGHSDSDSRLDDVHDEDWQAMGADKIRKVLDEAVAPEQVIFKALVEALRTPYSDEGGLYPDEDDWFEDETDESDVPPIPLWDGTELPWAEATPEQQQEAVELKKAELRAYEENVERITAEIRAKADTPEGAGSNVRLCPEEDFVRSLEALTVGRRRPGGSQDSHADAGEHIVSAYRDLLEQHDKVPENHRNHYEAAAFGRINDLLRGVTLPGWAVIEALLKHDGIDSREHRRNADGTLTPEDDQ